MFYNWQNPLSPKKEYPILNYQHERRVRKNLPEKHIVISKEIPWLAFNRWAFLPKSSELHCWTNSKTNKRSSWTSVMFGKGLKSVLNWNAPHIQGVGDGVCGLIGNRGLWLNVGGLTSLVLCMDSIKREHQNQWTVRHCYSDKTRRKHSIA